MTSLYRWRRIAVNQLCLPSVLSRTLLFLLAELHERTFDFSITGTDRYVATDDLMMAVNAAVTLGRPLSSKANPALAKRN